MNSRRLLHCLWFTPGFKGRWGIPVLVEGKPGSGKTAQIEDAAERLGFPCETVIASIREPADFLGLPIPEGGQVTYAAPSWAQRLATKGHGVAFLDELNTAPPAVQAALLRVVLDGVAGDLVLPKRVRFVAAQNAVDDAAGGHDLAMPLANRFCHWSWEAPDAAAWGEWALGLGNNGDHPEAEVDAEREERRVLAAWPEPWAKARGLVAGFLRKRPALLSKPPEAGDPAASKAWPSPRTWEMATRVLAGAEVHGLSEVESQFLIAGCVGNGAAAEFAAYQREVDLPDPADVLDGKVKFKPDARLDRTLATLGACAALVAPEGAAKRIERATALWAILDEVCGETRDLAVPAAEVLIQAKLGLDKVKTSRSPLAKLEPVLRIGKGGR